MTKLLWMLKRNWIKEGLIKMKFKSKNIPELITTERLMNGKWIPVRPINYKYESVWNRIKNSFMVLIGKYDVIEWE